MPPYNIKEPYERFVILMKYAGWSEQLVNLPANVTF